jgi:hypothetical protein
MIRPCVTDLLPSHRIILFTISSHLQIVSPLSSVLYCKLKYPTFFQSPLGTLSTKLFQEWRANFRQWSGPLLPDHYPVLSCASWRHPSYNGTGFIDVAPAGLLPHHFLPVSPDDCEASGWFRSEFIQRAYDTSFRYSRYNISLAYN